MEGSEAESNAMNDSFNYFTHPAFQVFTVIGLLYISAKLLSFMQLLASIFVIPGASVCLVPPALSTRPSAYLVTIGRTMYIVKGANGSNHED